MTTNPKWREITENIPRGDQTSDHPMLMSRIFQCKLDQFITDITENNAYGVPIANLYVIEFQKRGLPHAHILTILRNEDKLVDPERIDMLISAEIPDRNVESDLYDIVTRNMVHGPCGVLNPNCPCMVDGKCSKGYPKPFVAESTIDENDINHQRQVDYNEVEVYLNARYMSPPEAS
ncbi:hypothetical protein NQ314_015446 [Rhamnusium bicolor]|uniref:Helitron helicase-like domain-containing protein n=1 Tax=Rhamnusium bicolor TaxID=1586634 RepID=A0AAV8WY52_9CUCU|nr:hypothetical protein NQ314_015446 [Rhamnusium bicolor]